MIRNDIARVEADAIVNPAPGFCRAAAPAVPSGQAAGEQKQLEA